MQAYKRFLVWKNYGTYEGWRLEAQADTWDEAVAAWHATHDGYEDILITESIPLRVLDGRTVPLQGVPVLAER